MVVVDRVEAHQRGEQAHVRLGEGFPDQVAPGREPVRELVEPGEQPRVRLLVGGGRPGEPGLVDPVVDVTEDLLHDLLELVAVGLGEQVRRTLAMVSPPLVRQVERDLLEVVGDHRSARHVHDRRHGDPELVAGHAGLVGVLEARDAEHRVEPALVEVEGPAPPVVGRPGHPHRQDLLEPEQATDDDGPVGPRAGAADDEAVAPRLDRPAAGTVGGDAVIEVAHVALEGLLDVPTSDALVLVVVGPAHRCVSWVGP